MTSTWSCAMLEDRHANAGNWMRSPREMEAHCQITVSCSGHATALYVVQKHPHALQVHAPLSPPAPREAPSFLRIPAVLHVLILLVDQPAVARQKRAPGPEVAHEQGGGGGGGGGDPARVAGGKAAAGLAARARACVAGLAHGAYESLAARAAHPALEARVARAHEHTHRALHPKVVAHHLVRELPEPSPRLHGHAPGTLGPWLAWQTLAHSLERGLDRQRLAVDGRERVVRVLRAGDALVQRWDLLHAHEHRAWRALLESEMECARVGSVDDLPLRVWELGGEVAVAARGAAGALLALALVADGQAGVVELAPVEEAQR
eukprot:1593604-Rhodomonas_salina.1